MSPAGSGPAQELVQHLVDAGPGSMCGRLCGGAGPCGAWLPAPEPLGGFASRVSAEGGETGAEPPGAAHPVPSHCCLDPEPAPVDIPPVEGGEETPDSQVGAHLAGQVRGKPGSERGGGRSGFKVQSGCWKLAASPPLYPSVAERRQ